MGTVSKSITVIPSGTTGRTNMTTSSSYPESRGYNNTSNTSFARWTLSTNTAGYIYYTFDTSDILPSSATITSVTAKARCYVNNTTRVTNTVCQLYSGTTAKGSNATFASTSNTNIVTLSPGNSWALSDLDDLRIRIGATGSSSTSSKYVYFAGAEVVINYTVPTYDITINNSSSATVTASNSSPEAGEDVAIVANTISGLTITDNSVDVTSQFVTGVGGTVSSYPTSYQTGGSINGTNYQSTIGKGSDTANRTGNDYFSTTQGGSGSTWIDYYFDFSSIPTGATINSVTVTVKGHCEDASQSREIANVQLYSGTTAKGTSVDFTSTTDSVKTMSPGTWTQAELQDAKMRFTIGVYGGLISGATWTVVYEVEGYIYTISNVSSNHTISVTSGGVTQTIYFKNNGSWVAATAVYKKVSGSWVLQSNLTNVFDSSTNYVKG